MESAKEIAYEIFEPSSLTQKVHANFIDLVSPGADLFHQFLAAILSTRRKITKPPIHGRAQINQ
jgi:hypothetical protein